MIGTQANDILRDPTRLNESEMGNLVADAMRAKHPELDGRTPTPVACGPTSSARPRARGGPCEITWGEMFAVLPFGNRTVILTLTGDQLRRAFENGFSPVCDSSIATGRFPQISGLRATFTCSGTTPVVTGMWKTPQGLGGSRRRSPRRHGADRHQRLHVHRRRRLHGLRPGTCSSPVTT